MCCWQTDSAIFWLRNGGKVLQISMNYYIQNISLNFYNNVDQALFFGCINVHTRFSTSPFGSGKHCCMFDPFFLHLVMCTCKVRCLVLLLNLYLRNNLSQALICNIFKCKIVNIFSPIIFNICFRCSNKPSHWEGSFEYPQHMFWLN